MSRITIVLTVVDLGSCGSVANDPDGGPADAAFADAGLADAATSPRIVNVTSPFTDGGYSTSSTLSIAVTFSEAVTVTGVPELALNSGAPPVGYDSDSGTNTLSFAYVVAAGEETPWELYDLSTDRTETNNLAAAQPERVAAMQEAWQQHLKEFVSVR